MRKTTWLFAAVVFSVSCDLSPVSWSPDGKRFAFTVMKHYPQGAFFEEAAIFVYDIDTDKSSILHRTKRANLSAPSFSPDGKTIAFMQEGELVNEVVTILFRIMAADGGDPVTIGSTRLAVEIGRPWNQPGMMLPCLAGGAPIWLSNSEILVPDYGPVSSKFGIVALNVKTRERRSVLETADWPVLSPDAKRLLFCDPDSLALRIKRLDNGALEWVAGVDPTKLNRVSRNYGPFNRQPGVSWLAWSPGGDAIYGVRDEDSQDGQSDDLVRLDLRSGEVTKLFTGDTPRTVQGFSASSDGRRLVVIKKETGLASEDLGADLILIRTDGADDEPQVIGIDGVTNKWGHHVSWSPTDTHFVVRTTTSAASTGKTRFQMFDAEGKLVRIINAPALGEGG